MCNSCYKLLNCVYVSIKIVGFFYQQLCRFVLDITKLFNEVARFCKMLLFYSNLKQKSQNDLQVSAENK